MLIICPNCFTKFEVDNHLITKSVQKFQCSNCGERFEEHLEQSVVPLRVDIGTMVAQKPVRGDEALSIRPAVEENDTGFTFSKEDDLSMDDDLSVQSLPEEFMPVSEKKKKNGGLFFTFLFLLMIVGALGYVWINRYELLTQYPNIDRGVKLVFGETKKADTVPEVQNVIVESDVVATPLSVADMGEAEASAPAPMDPTQEIIAQGDQNKNTAVITPPKRTPAIGNIGQVNEFVQPQSMPAAVIQPAQMSNEGMEQPIQDATGQQVGNGAFEEIDVNAVPELKEVDLPTNMEELAVETIVIDDEMSDTTALNAPINLNIAPAPVVPVASALEKNVTPSVPQETIVIDSQEQPTTAEEMSVVQVKDVVFRYDNSSATGAKLYVQGIVSNTGLEKIRMPALSVEMYDKDNSLIGTQIMPASASILAPKMAEFFFVEVKPLPQGLVKRVRVTIKG